MTDHWFVGVDGGGTRCRVRVCDGAGVTRAQGEGGPANVTLDRAAALATLVALLRDVLARIDLPRGATLRLALGLAGTSDPEAVASVMHALAPFGSCTVTHDGAIACIGAHDGADGGIVIAGTGSAAVARLGGRVVSIGGRGFLMGDEGSGARLGLEAMRRALRAHDELEPHTPLTRALMARHGNDPAKLIGWARGAPSHAFADLAPTLFASAGAGDRVALDLVRAGAAAVAELGSALSRLGATRISLLGGLADPLRRWLPPTAVDLFRPPLRDALDGALLLAGAPLAPLATGACRAAARP